MQFVRYVYECNVSLPFASCDLTSHTTDTHNSMSSLKYALESENARVHQRVIKASRPPPLLPVFWPSTLLEDLLYLSMLQAAANVQVTYVWYSVGVAFHI